MVDLDAMESLVAQGKMAAPAKTDVMAQTVTADPRETKATQAVKDLQVFKVFVAPKVTRATLVLEGLAALKVFPAPADRRVPTARMVCR